MTPYAQLLQRCGLSSRAAARLLCVSERTAEAWKQGRRDPPPGVLSQLEQYAEAAGRIFAITEADCAVCGGG